MAAALVGGLAIGQWTARPTERPLTAIAADVRTLDDHIADLEQRSQQRPEHLATWQALGGAYVQQVAQTGDATYYALAEAAFDRADGLEDGAPETAIGRAGLALSQHEFGQALDLAESVLDQRPRNSAAMIVAVDANVELGRYDAAADRLQALLDVKPALPALARTSYLRELYGDLPGAVAAMEAARTAGSGAPYDLATVVTLLGDLHLRAGDVPLATTTYEQALEISPGLALAEVGLARAEAAGGDVAGATTRLETLLDRAPLPAAAILLSDLRTRAGDGDGADRADELVRALLALQENAGQVVDLELALFEADRGQGRRALRLAEQTYRTRPTVFAASAIGWTLHVTGDDDAAVPFIDESLRLGTKDGLLHFHAASVFAALGRDDRARASLQVVFDDDPWFSFRHQPAARRLAADLGLEPPSSWGDAT